MTAATEDYITELLADRRDVFNKLHAQIRNNRALRYGEHEVPIPTAYQSSTQLIRSPVVPDILFRVIATITTDDPAVSVPPFSRTEKAKRNASLLEKWSLASLKQLMRESQRDVFRMGIDAAAADGLGIWKCVDRMDVWTGFPRRKTDEEAADYLGRTDKFVKSKPLPFHWTDVDPLTYFSLPDAYGALDEVLEVTKRAAVPAMKAFNVRKVRGQTGYGKRKPGEKLSDDNDYAGETWDCVEHWTGNEVTFKLNDEIVEQKTVNYGRPPYFPLGGHMTSSRDPHRQYQSIIQPFAHLIPALDSVLSMTSNWVYLSAYPFLRLLDPNIAMRAGGMIAGQGPANPISVSDILPGEVLQNVEFMVAPSISKGVSDMVNLLNMMIDRSGLAAVMYGQGLSGTSGYMVSQLMTAAQLVYAPIIDNARMALEQLIPFMWYLVENRLRRTVYVWGKGTRQGDWLGLGPDDVDNYSACIVTIKPILPMDEIAQRDSSLRMVQGGLWSKEYAREHTGTGQPEEMADQIAVEKYEDLPQIAEKIAVDAATRAGLIKPEPPPEPNIGPIGPIGPIPGGGPMGPDGQPMGPQGPGGPGGPGFSPSMGITPTVPGQGEPLVPPPPTGAGGRPVGVQNQPANRPTRPGAI